MFPSYLLHFFLVANSPKEGLREKFQGEMGLLRLENGITRRIFLAFTDLLYGGEESESLRVISHPGPIDSTFALQKF